MISGLGNEQFPERNSTMQTLGASSLPTVLLAAGDTEIRDTMSQLLAPYNVNAVRTKGLEEIRAVLARERVAACLCGFWLVDGTYRDLIRLLKRQPVEIPAIVVCEPGCPQEYRDYLAALNIRAFDFICHPYRSSDVERILESAIISYQRSARFSTSPGNAAIDPLSPLSPSALRRAS
jgi:DNA-binding NtrC family response regulator